METPNPAAPVSPMPLAGRVLIWVVRILFFAILLPMLGIAIYWVLWFFKGLGQLH
jgi:hypothetical protein